MLSYIIAALVVVILLLLFGLYALRWWVYKPDANYILRFVTKNPERASLSLAKNGEMLADIQSVQLRPLASTVKIIIAIEFSRQVAQNEISPAEWIEIGKLERFYIPKTDGGAHEGWLKTMDNEGRIKANTVRLEEVAKGMISHSSNANTEYLMTRLGLNHINANLEELQLPHHEEIYPFVSSLLIPYEVARRHGFNILNQKDVKKVKTLIDEMSQQAYIKEAMNIHEKLIQDYDGSYIKQANLPAWHNKTFDRLASKRFTRATTSEYVSIVQKIIDPNYFPESVHSRLRPIMEWPMKQTNNQKRFHHLGGKGGSTAYILTYALYAEDKKGNRTELAVFLNDLGGYESAKLSNCLNSFQLAIITDAPNLNLNKANSNNKSPDSQ